MKGSLLWVFVGLLSSTCATILCQTCIPLELQTAPAIGIDLSMDYGSASVKLYNGKLIDVARIDGSPAYLSTMRKLYEGAYNDSFLLQLPSYVQKPKGQPSSLSIFNQAPRVVQEWIPFFKPIEPDTEPAREFATDPNVVALSSMLVALRNAIVERLGSPLVSPRIVLTIPDSLRRPLRSYHPLLHIAAEASQLPVAAERDVQFTTIVALEHHGIPVLCGYNDPFFTETNIHCNPSSDEKVDTVLSLTYTAGGLSVVLLDRFQRYMTALSAKEYNDLGAESKLREKASEEYWKQVRVVIEITLAEQRMVDHLEIFGAYGNDGEFRKLVREVLESRGCGETIKRSLRRIGGEDIGFTAARGDAEIARDVLRGFYDGCEYSQYCIDRDAL